MQTECAHLKKINIPSTSDKKLKHKLKKTRTIISLFYLMHLHPLTMTSQGAGATEMMSCMWLRMPTFSLALIFVCFCPCF